MMSGDANILIQCTGNYYNCLLLEMKCNFNHDKCNPLNPYSDNHHCSNHYPKHRYIHNAIHHITTGPTLSPQVPSRRAQLQQLARRSSTVSRTVTSPNLTSWELGGSIPT